MNFRRLFFLFISLIVANIICAQVPQAFHYQMVVRDANDVLVRSHSVGLRLTIQRNGGSPIYQETHNVMTDANGLLQIEVGRGTRNTTYGEFNAIPWGDYNDIVLISDIDPAGGTSYSLTATQPLQAVPYAFMADEHQDLANATALGNRAGNYQLKSVKDPTDPQDVITKRYLDSVLAELVRRSNTLTRDTAACVNPSVTPYAWRGQSISIASTGSHTYTHTKPGAGAGGLDSIIILTLRVDEGTHNVNIINQAGAYTWHGNNYASTGTYTYAYTDGNGCPSVDTLKLTISAAVVYGDSSATKCGSFTWYGTPLLASGDYTHTFVGAGPGGVDSILRLHLTIKPLGNRTLTETRCDTYHWDLEDADYTSTGTYSHTITGGSANGCDSIVRLELTINQTVYRDSAANECEHFTWYGNDYNTTGPQTKTFTAANGCDSTIRLALTIRPKATSTDVHSACDSYDWIDGNNYTSDNNSATYTFAFGAANGCDSTVTLNLTINTATVGTDTRTECDSYTWIDGNTYTVSNNTATHHTTNVAGCDSTVTLNLTINYSTSAIDQQVACDSYTWIDGNSYNSNNNTATHRLDNAAGCDSNITLNLVVRSSSSSNVTENVCGGIATYRDNTYIATTSGAVYEIHLSNALGCDSTVHLTVYNRAYTGAGLSFDTVCAGTTSYTWSDWNDESTELQNVTVYSEDFEGLGTGGSPTGGWWGERTSTTTMTGFKAYSTFSSYVPSAQHGSKFLINVGTDEYDYQAAGIYTPGFTLTGGQTTISFYYRQNATAYYPYMTIWVTNSQNDNWASGTYVKSIFNNSNALQTSWTPSTTTITPAAGTYYLMFYCEGANISWLAIDNIVITERRNVTVYTPHVTDLSSTPNGSNWTSGVTTNAYGCPVSGRYIHKRAVGESFTEVACESYRWINGTTYTENQSNRLYNHTRTYNTHSCNVTDTLNLTINTSASSAATQTATNNYIWATSGIDGHGTGLTYGYSGNYIGPYYATGACQSRDTLHLTVNRVACAGSKYTVSSCTPFTWVASGAYGKGTGSTYSAVGTNQYVGPEYTPAGCAEGIHDTLILTYGTAASTRYDVTECDNYTWPASGAKGHGTTTTYSTLGNHRYTGPTYYTAVGCLSVDTLNLTLNASIHTSETQTVCDGVIWHEVNRTTTGDHVYNYTNGAGCASTETLHLTVKNSAVTNLNLTICSGATTVEGPSQQLFYDDFEDASSLSAWDIYTGDEVYDLYGWLRTTQDAYSGYSLRVKSPEHSVWSPYTGTDYDVYGSSFAITPAMTIAYPANTTLTFRIKAPAVYKSWWRSGYYPELLNVYYMTPAQAAVEWDDDIIESQMASQVLWTNDGTTAYENWTQISVPLSSIPAGTYHIVFRDYDSWSYVAIDEVDVTGSVGITVPDGVTNGQTTATHYTAANGCDSTVNITWTVTSCGGHIDLNIDPAFASPIRENHPTPEYIESENSRGDCAPQDLKENNKEENKALDESRCLGLYEYRDNSKASEYSEYPEASEKTLFYYRRGRECYFTESTSVTMY